MAQHTSDEGVYQVWEAISVLEQITFKPYEHSASENLYTRKLHYERKRTAGYSVWPMGGWEALWKRMADAFEALGGTLIQPAKVERVIVRDGAVRGVELPTARRAAGGRRGRRQRARVGHPEAVRRRRAAVGLRCSA